MTDSIIDGMSKDEAMTFLISDQGMTFKEAGEFWVENRPERGTGFAARFYAALESAEMDDDAFADFLDGESKNVVAHKSHYDAIRKLANAVRANVLAEAA